jgi:hypothetical protein
MNARSVPQIGGMFEGDKSRKTVLVEYASGCRARWTIAPKFEEFQAMMNQTIYVRRHAGEAEIEWAVCIGRHPLPIEGGMWPGEGLPIFSQKHPSSSPSRFAEEGRSPPASRTRRAPDRSD